MNRCLRLTAARGGARKRGWWELPSALTTSCRRHLMLSTETQPTMLLTRRPYACQSLRVSLVPNSSRYAFNEGLPQSDLGQSLMDVGERMRFSTISMPDDDSPPFSSPLDTYSSDSPGPISTKLKELVVKGAKQMDSHQLTAALELDRLYHDLVNEASSDDASSPPRPSAKDTQKSGGFFSSIFAGGSSQVSSTTSESSLLSPSIKGVYLYGGVGCGKTFLMKLFYDALPSSFDGQKQQIHFHKFMLYIHAQLHQARKNKSTIHPATSQDDLLSMVIDDIMSNGRILCLDEFQVTDVADAMILKSLFEGLWRKGCILIATSNRPPHDLYLHGLQRDRFLPFCDDLVEQCEIVNMMESETDYRMTLGGGGGDTSADQTMTVYYSKENRKQYTELFHRLTQHAPIRPMNLVTQGRNVPIPFAAERKGVARFTFKDLCRKALGAADYLVIGQNFHTIFVDNIPKLTVNEVNWLRRFITFIDTMYECQCTVVLQHQSDTIDGIFQVPENKQDYVHDEVFAFDRTRSRLEEMASRQYLQQQWGGARHKDSARGYWGVKKELNFQPTLSDSKTKLTNKK